MPYSMDLDLLLYNICLNFGLDKKPNWVSVCPYFFLLSFRTMSEYHTEQRSKSSTIS